MLFRSRHFDQLVQSLGFFPFDMALDVLEEMQGYSNAILFLGLIFDIIILLFVVLSVLLIYSLLMISVESKTFEFGVMRMVGLSKSGLIMMIILQGVMFVLPSMVAGFACSFPALELIGRYLFGDDSELRYKSIPTASAILQATLIGLLIPLLSSIIPIQNALSKNLNESLDI